MLLYKNKTWAGQKLDFVLLCSLFLEVCVLLLLFVLCFCFHILFCFVFRFVLICLFV